MSSFNLTVQVDAKEWAYCQRRLTFLQSLVVALSRDGLDMQEWFSAAELAAMRLPGLPASAGALARKANLGNWPRQRIGRHVAYHVAGLPARAFDTLVMRKFGLEGVEAAGLLRPPPDTGAPNTAPPWVLPLMRLMRGEAKGDLGKAWRALPEHMPPGASVPTADEAATVLVELGLSEKIASWREH